MLLLSLSIICIMCVRGVETGVKKMSPCEILKNKNGIIVIYWPSTEPSIKRWTCVNKRKNSGSRWMLDNNIARCTDDSSQLETRCRSESQRQTESFGPSVTHGWATPAKIRKKSCYGREKNLGQYSNLSLSPVHLSRTTNITLLKIKCEILYFYKEVYSFVHWSSSLQLIMCYVLTCWPGQKCLSR